MSKSLSDVTFVAGWSFEKAYGNWYERTGPYVYTLAACYVYNHPRFGNTYSYLSTPITSIGEDDLGVYVNVLSGKRIYLADHYSDLTT